MMKKGKSRIIFLVLFIAGFLVSFVYGSYRMEKQRAIMQGETDKSERKTEQLQRRYAEQKATADKLQRMNISIAGQKNTLQAEIDKIKTDYAGLEDGFIKLKALEDEGKNKLAECENNYDTLLAKNNELEKGLEEEKTLLAETKKVHEEQIRQIERERDDRISELRALNNRMDSCVRKNARLIIIAEELLDRYESKGVMSSLLEKEPMTQIKKVELEKLAQEYKATIEKQREIIREQ